MEEILIGSCSLFYCRQLGHNSRSNGTMVMKMSFLFFFNADFSHINVPEFMSGDYKKIFTNDKEKLCE